MILQENIVNKCLGKIASPFWGHFQVTLPCLGKLSRTEKAYLPCINFNKWVYLDTKAYMKYEYTTHLSMAYTLIITHRQEIQCPVKPCLRGKYARQENQQNITKMIM